MGRDSVVIGLAGTTWALVAVSIVLAGLIVILVGAWMTGRLTIDLGWGRSVHPLGPIALTVAAPRDTVFQVLAAPYRERAPREVREQVELLDSGEGLVVAAHHTRLRGFTSTTVESVRLAPPERIEFRGLRGPPPAVHEEFVLSEEGDGTKVEYRGELALDFWVFGRLGARVMRPTWERVVRRHLEDAKRMAEDRARVMRNGR
jgi:Polyketide cyclase / dehydrase and lipid transport